MPSHQNLSKKRLKAYAIDAGIVKPRSRFKTRDELMRVIERVRIEKAIVLQSVFRQHLAYLEIEDRRSQIREPDHEWRNSETLLGDNIYEIPLDYFYSVDGYAFDIRELNQTRGRNPYINLPFATKIKNQINRIITSLQKRNISIEIENPIPIDSQISATLTDVCNRLGDFGHSVAPQIFIDWTTYYMNAFYKRINEHPIIYQKIGYVEHVEFIDAYESNDLNKMRYHCLEILKQLIFTNDETVDIRILIIANALNDNNNGNNNGDINGDSSASDNF